MSLLDHGIPSLYWFLLRLYCICNTCFAIFCNEFYFSFFFSLLFFVVCFCFNGDWFEWVVSTSSFFQILFQKLCLDMNIDFKIAIFYLRIVSQISFSTPMPSLCYLLPIKNLIFFLFLFFPLLTFAAFVITPETVFSFYGNRSKLLIGFQICFLNLIEHASLLW